MDMNTTTERPAIPNNAWDREYMTQWRKEVRFLQTKGIEYTFAKRVGEYQISTYKYTKTPELFLALAEFYNQERNLKTEHAIEKTKEEIKLPIEKGFIDIKPDKAEEKLMRGITKADIMKKLSDMDDSASAEEIQNAIKDMQDDTE